MSALEKVKQAFLEREATQKSENWKKYLQIIDRLVNDQKIDPNEVAIVLELAGRSIDDLAADCENAKYRIAIRQRAKESAAAKPKFDAAVADLEKLTAEKSTFVQEINKRIAEAEELVERYRADVIAGQSSERDLLASCKDPGLNRAIELIDSELQNLVREQNALGPQGGIYQPAPDSPQRLTELNKSIKALRQKREKVVSEMVNQ